MAMDYKALGAKAVSEGADQTKAVSGGGDFEPAAAGPCLLRFVGYVEIGKQKGTFQGKPTIKEKVQLIFELVGKRHPPTETKDGVKIPQRITVEESYNSRGLHEKANLFKLFQRMNYRQDAQHLVQLLGEGFKGEVFHDKWTDKAGKERISAVLKGPAGYSIAPPRKEDEDSETGWVDVAVPQALSEPRCFLWAQADLAQWASLYIEGEYPERKDDKGVITAPARSKNVFQNKIKAAVNFQGSPIYVLLAANGQSIDIPTVDEQDADAGNVPATAAGPASPTSHYNDALGGIV